MNSYIIFLFLSLFFLQGCSDNAIVTIFDKKITEEKIECLKLVVFPPDEMLETTLKQLYTFDEDCSLKLEVSKKGGIVCNSNQNSQKKALSNFPSSYLKMQISSNKIHYSYYIDLSDDVTSEDIKKAFARIKKDIIIQKD